MTMTIDQWAKDALQVQDASNLNGVVNSYREFLNQCIDEGLGNDHRHHHPVSVAFAYKIASLCGMEPLGCKVANDAFHWLERVKAGEMDASWIVLAFDLAV